MKLPHSQKIKQEAYRLGFDFVGISKARQLEEDAQKLEEWLSLKGQAKMAYMENHFDKRVDPRKLVEGTKSVVSLLYNYHTKNVNKIPKPQKLPSMHTGKTIIW